MAFSKIILNGTTLIDVTQDTVAASNLYLGQTAHGADGEPVTGAGGAVLVTDTTDSVAGGTITTITAPNELHLQSKTITPTSSQQTITPDTGYGALSQVVAEAVVCDNLTAANIVSGVTVKVGTATDDDSVASVTGTASGGGMPPEISYIEVTPVSNATQSSKLSVQLPVMSSYVIAIRALSIPSSDTSLYWAIMWVQGLWSGGSGNQNASSAILRPDGTYGSDYGMASYSTSTGILQLGGQYGYFKAGITYRIYAINLTP